MKTAGRENPNRWTILSSNRAPGAGGQNRSCSIQWAAKQEKFRPMQECFFLTSTFIELHQANDPPFRGRVSSSAFHAMPTLRRGTHDDSSAATLHEIGRKGT